MLKYCLELSGYQEIAVKNPSIETLQIVCHAVWCLDALKHDKWTPKKKNWRKWRAIEPKLPKLPYCQIAKLQVARSRFLDFLLFFSGHFLTCYSFLDYGHDNHLAIWDIFNHLKRLGTTWTRNLRNISIVQVNLDTLIA